jgi:hypothetical protein
VREQLGWLQKKSEAQSENIASGVLQLETIQKETARLKKVRDRSGPENRLQRVKKMLETSDNDVSAARCLRRGAARS